MKLIFLGKINALGLLLVLFCACEKKVDPIDTYSVTVDYKNGHARAVTQNVEINPGDSIFFDVTVTSEKDMSYVEIQKNGVKIDTFNVAASGKNSFSVLKGYKADTIPGNYTYRVLARNKQAVFLGDGDKLLTVTVKPDFIFWSYRIMAVPDTLSKTNKSYYATTTGTTYSYLEGAANSASIDFGYYYDTTTALKHTIYALSATQPQLAYYDIAGWTKNATIFKKLPSSVNFVSGLTSGGALRTVGISNLASGATSKVTALAASSGNNTIAFKTAAGKYGAILIRFISQDSPAKETFIEVDVKVQK